MFLRGSAMQKVLITSLAWLLLIGQAFAQLQTPTGVSTDISGTVTTGGTYQTIAAANSLRKNCTIQNPTTATEVLNVKIGTMAQTFTLSAGMSISTSSGIAGANDPITVMAATTGHAFAGICQ